MAGHDEHERQAKCMCCVNRRAGGRLLEQSCGTYWRHLLWLLSRTVLPTRRPIFGCDGWAMVAAVNGQSP